MSLVFYDPYCYYYYYYGYLPPPYPIPIPIPIVPIAPIWHPLCPFCKKPLVWVLPIGRWYCEHCKLYF